MPSKCKNVTKETFSQKARDFMAFSQGEGAEYGLTITKGDYPGPWMAWKTYRERRELPMAYYEKADKYLVPAKWPHEFDAEWNPEWDGRWINHVIPKQGLGSQEDLHHRKMVVRRTMERVKKTEDLGHSKYDWQPEPGFEKY